ncbi:MAG TPA: PaaI family thioesterase [Clostridia bacterium]|jgi:acyl-coenzyme A thioesterase PaaI-like protein|nr:PaaI family thioesterase [Clostridia bacterium]HHY06778.1 PaaI family thioesterase [Clostridia bacterium]
MPFNYDHCCFACGKRNPDGLKLRFVQEDNIISTTFTPPEIYQGYPGILHGGITSTVFDEVMSQCLWAQGQAGFTARLEVRFRQNIPIQKPVKFEAWIVKQKGRLVDLESRALLENGKVAAEAKGRFMLIAEIHE